MNPQDPIVAQLCLVGGRVLHAEPLENAVRRHLRATLGSGIEVDPATLRPVGVIEYFSQTGIGEFHDPRKHAVSVTCGQGTIIGRSSAKNPMT